MVTTLNSLRMTNLLNPMLIPTNEETEEEEDQGM